MNPSAPPDAAAQQRLLRRKALSVAALCALAMVLIGGLATDVGPWYAALKKPPWQPPDWAFGPAWTLIYALGIWSATVAWCARDEPAWRRALLWAWAFNGCVNILWSVLFFQLHRPDWALYEVVVLWLSIGALVFISAHASRKAAWLLLPYLAWVSFAALVNRAVVQLNEPFGR